MDWTAIIDRDREALKRIVAVLVSLAALAELAGSKRGPLRAAVLWFLGPAETVARDFVMGLREDFSGRSDLSISPSAHDASDAMRLARSFRALAGLLRDLMRCCLASPSARTGLCLTGSHLRKFQGLSQMLPLVAWAPPDTS